MVEDSRFVDKEALVRRKARRVDRVASDIVGCRGGRMQASCVGPGTRAELSKSRSVSDVKARIQVHVKVSDPIN
jgi:hypothetical protein